MSNSSRSAPGKALVIMVSEDGQVENRVIDTPLGLPVSALIEAVNYLNARLRGRTLDDARAEILAELESEKLELDTLTAKIVAEGPGDPGGGRNEKVLIVRGASHLLDTASAIWWRPISPPASRWGRAPCPSGCLWRCRRPPSAM